MVSIATLTLSELKGFVVTLRLELPVKDQTLILCLKAALTLEEKQELLAVISEAGTATVPGLCPLSPDAELQGTEWGQHYGIPDPEGLAAQAWAHPSSRV